MSFWDTATTEQKLAQIDGGIECGMNASQIAFNCGLRATEKTPAAILLRGFAVTHGRDFSHVGVGKMGFTARQNTAHRMRALERGCPEYSLNHRSVSKVKKSIDRTHDIPADALSIFGNEPQEEILSWAEAAQ